MVNREITMTFKISGKISGMALFLMSAIALPATSGPAVAREVGAVQREKDRVEWHRAWQRYSLDRQDHRKRQDRAPKHKVGDGKA